MPRNSVIPRMAGLAMLGALTLAGCAGGEPSSAVPHSLEAARELAAKRGTPVLLEFFTDW